MTNVDQVSRRRFTKTGLTALDPDLASHGFTLYTPGGGDGTVYLVDINGENVHTWKMPYPPGLYGYLLPDGNLFYNGQTPDTEPEERFPNWRRFKGGVMQVADWDGNIIWEHYDPDHHHDARRTDTGGAIYLTVERVPEELAARVKGGVAGSDARGMWADVIVEVDSEGNRIWEWQAKDHLDTNLDVLTYNDSRGEWSHGNTVVPIAGNRVLASFRNISTVVIIDKKTGEIVWRLGHDTLSQQHDPSMLDNGNILIYDNGAYRKTVPMPASRVIEVDPSTNEIVWEYKDSMPPSFFSAYISGARRLSNGNTLITEGITGRMFQVTSDGDVVWEYTNPHWQTRADGTVFNNVFRANHYMAEEIPALSQGH